MDKYGVELDNDKVKTASEGCPKCGASLTSETPSYCENCGTEPFERSDNVSGKKDKK